MSCNHWKSWCTRGNGHVCGDGPQSYVKVAQVMYPCETSYRSSATVLLSGAYNFNKRLHNFYKVRTYIVLLFYYVNLYTVSLQYIMLACDLTISNDCLAITQHVL